MLGWSQLAAAAVCWLGAVSGHFELLVLHTNDMHSRFDPIDVNDRPISGRSDSNATAQYGGFARLMFAVDAARNEAKRAGLPSLFLNAGDTFFGTAFYSILKQEVVASLLPPLGIQAMSLGNHEFDDGPEMLLKYLRSINTRVVVSNLDFSREPNLYNLPNLSKSHIIDVNGVLIGIVGYLTPTTQENAKIGNVIFNDEVESLKRETSILKEQGVNIIIAVGHAGFEMDERIAREVPVVSLVIGAHTNTFLYTPPDNPPSNNQPVGPYPFLVTQQSGRKVPVVTAYAYTKYLGKLWATFDENGDFVSARNESNPQLLDSSVPTDPFMQVIVDIWRSKIEKKLSEVVGRSSVYLDAWKAYCKVRECNLGNLITDAFIDYVAERYESIHGWTDAAIAIQQSGAIRPALFPTRINRNMTYQEVLSFLPYNSELYKVRLSGRTLRSALEHSVSDYEYKYDQEVSNKFLHVSGLHITYDMKNPPGNRVIQVTVRCANCSVPIYSELDNKNVYTVIMSQFLADGKDGFVMLKTKDVNPQAILSDDRLTGMTDTNALALFMKKSRVTYPEIDGRITILNPTLATHSASSMSPARDHLTLASVLVIVFRFLC